MSARADLPRSPFDHLVLLGYSTVEHDHDGPASMAFEALMSRVFTHLLSLPGDPLWLGIVEVLSPGSSAWLDAFGDEGMVLEEGANWWPGTERLSPGDVRVRAIPVDAFGRAWSRIDATVGEGLYSAFDPFLFSRHPGGDLCHLLTVGHEGTAICALSESDSATARWLESVGFSDAGAFEPTLDRAGKSVLCGVRSAREQAEIFGE
ncbi:MAG: hypothetical protein ABJE95_28535 [Byssovorax sp.]